MPERKGEPLQTGNACDRLSYNLPPHQLLFRLNNMSSKTHCGEWGQWRGNCSRETESEGMQMASLHRESWCSWCMQLCSVGYPGLSPCTHLCSEKRLLTWNLRGFVMETLQSIYPLHPWHVLVFCSYTDRLFRRSNALEWTRQEQWTRTCSWVKWCELSTWIQRGDWLIQIHSLFHGAIWSI